MFIYEKSIFELSEEKTWNWIVNKINYKFTKIYKNYSVTNKNDFS